MREELVFETVGDFLLRLRRELGIPHLCGVAGDFNLEFLEQLAKTPDMHWVGCCNELDAAYAADGHARTRGRIGRASPWSRPSLRTYTQKSRLTPKSSLARSSSCSEFAMTRKR
jgi:hypothetical protein